MRELNAKVVAISVALITAAGAVWADDAKKSAAPTLSNVLDASGITLTGYIDGTYQYLSQSGGGATTPDYSSFALGQAAFTLAKQPTEGFGALVNAIAGADVGALGLPGGSGNFDLLQAFVQYATGPWTIMAGKYPTLAGVEVVAPTGNANVTRSLLWDHEPITHTGVRATYVANDQFTINFGVNNGWDASFTDYSANSSKTAEAGLTWTASKAFSLAVAGTRGQDQFTFGNGTGTHTLLDGIATWNATSALTVIASYDRDQQAIIGGSTLSYSGEALYLNWAINDAWRLSARVEQFNDSDGFLSGAKQKSTEETLTFGFAPTKNSELRFEGRYDSSNLANSASATQGWLQALYKF